MPRIVTSSSRNIKTRAPRFIGLAILVLSAISFAIFCPRLFKDAKVPMSEPEVETAPISASAKQGKQYVSKDTVFKTPLQSESVEAESTFDSTDTGAESTKVKAKTPEELGLPIVDVEAKKKQRMSFETNTERIIAGLANTKRGYAPPPLLNLPMGENLMEILDRDILIYEDDDEKIAQAKENCAALKAELKKYLEEGGTPENFLSWYHNELAKDYNSWKDSQMNIVQMMKEGMVVEAEEYMEQANKDLTAAGIRNVTIPDNLRKLGEKKLKELQETTR